MVWKEVKPSAEGLRNGDYYIDADALRAVFAEKFDAICDEDGTVSEPVLPDDGTIPDPDAVDDDPHTVTLTKEEYVDRETAGFLARTALFVNPGDELFSVKVQTEKTFTQEPPEWMARYTVKYLPLEEKIRSDVDMTAEQCWSFIRLYEEAPADPAEPGAEEPAGPGIMAFLNKIAAFFQKLLQFIRGLFGG